MSSSSIAKPLIKKPILVEVDNNLFLATFTLLTNESVLKENQIVRVLMLTAKRPDSLSQRVSGVYYKYIDLDEYSTDHIILFFEQCFNYICEAQTYDENVVVMSRGMESISVTIVTAFLMKKYRISTVEAIVRIQQNWKLSPNAKFLQHLYLWEYMDFRLKANEPQLRRFLIDWFRYELESILFNNELDFEHFLIEFADISIDFMFVRNYLEQKDPTFQESATEYVCTFCSKHLFREKNVIKNDVYFDCKYIYTEPISWVLGELYERADKVRKEMLKGITTQENVNFQFGQIFCHKCHILIGIYDWNPRNGCSCPLHADLQRYLNYRFFTEKVDCKTRTDLKPNK